jgi:hypothetical protein
VQMSVIMELGLRLMRFVTEGGQDFAWERGTTPLSATTWPVAACALYVLAVITLRYTIKKPLRVPAWVPAAHNLGLCWASGIMFVGCSVALARVRALASALKPCVAACAM